MFCNLHGGHATQVRLILYLEESTTVTYHAYTPHIYNKNIYVMKSCRITHILSVGTFIEHDILHHVYLLEYSLSVGHTMAYPNPVCATELAVLQFLLCDSAYRICRKMVMGLLAQQRCPAYVCGWRSP